MDKSLTAKSSKNKPNEFKSFIRSFGEILRARQAIEVSTKCLVSEDLIDVLERMLGFHAFMFSMINKSFKASIYSSNVLGSIVFELEERMSSIIVVLGASVDMFLARLRRIILNISGFLFLNFSFSLFSKTKRPS